MCCIGDVIGDGIGDGIGCMGCACDCIGSYAGSV
jgi:hypothetical protein